MLYEPADFDVELLDSFDASSFGETRLSAESLGDLVSPSGLPYFESTPFTPELGYLRPLLKAETAEFEMAYFHPDRKVWIQGTPRAEVKYPEGHSGRLPGAADISLYDRVTGDYLGLIPSLLKMD